MPVLILMTIIIPLPSFVIGILYWINLKRMKNMIWTGPICSMVSATGAARRRKKSIAYVEEETKKNGSDDIEVYAAAADEIYHDIDHKLTQEQRDKLPAWKTELVMQNHGVGGYTSRAVGKRWNRRCGGACGYG